MGGVLVIGTVFLASVLWARPDNRFVWLVLVSMLYLGVLGFLDDYLKVTKKKSDGVPGRVKLAAQLVLAAVVTVVFLTSPLLQVQARSLYLPFFKAPVITDMGWFALIFFAVVIVGSSNAVNLTDGLDGLATGASALVFSAYVVVGIWQANQTCGVTLNSKCYDVRDPLDLAVVAASIAGACIGFLWWNASPAQIFMGDTGSLALGAALAGLAILSRTELLLVVLGGLFVVETLSVMLQVGFFKVSRGRRIFKMAPIHHHFEMLGWEQITVVIRFWVITGLCVAAGVGIFYAEWVTGN
jgi:phospho-N-acetylmuramoyl-pentapeptide-transferase